MNMLTLLKHDLVYLFISMSAVFAVFVGVVFLLTLVEPKEETTLVLDHIPINKQMQPIEEHCK